LTKVSAIAHVAHWGTCVTTLIVSASRATIRIGTRIEKSHDATGLQLETTILDSAATSLASSRIQIAGDQVTQDLEVSSPALWSPEHAHLYVARSVILENGSPIDNYVTTFGIREVRFDKDRAFV